METQQAGGSAKRPRPDCTLLTASGPAPEGVLWSIYLRPCIEFLKQCENGPFWEAANDSQTDFYAAWEGTPHENTHKCTLLSIVSALAQAAVPGDDCEFPFPGKLSLPVAKDGESESEKDMILFPQCARLDALVACFKGLYNPTPPDRFHLTCGKPIDPEMLSDLEDDLAHAPWHLMLTYRDDPHKNAAENWGTLHAFHWDKRDIPLSPPIPIVPPSIPRDFPINAVCRLSWRVNGYKDRTGHGTIAMYQGQAVGLSTAHPSIWFFDVTPSAQFVLEEVDDNFEWIDFIQRSDGSHLYSSVPLYPPADTAGRGRYVAKSTRSDATSDLLAFQLPQGQVSGALELGDNIRVGDQVWLVHPLTYDVKSNLVGRLGAVVSVIAVGGFANVKLNEREASFDEFSYSGCPIIDVHGRLVGIATAGSIDKSGYHLVCVLPLASLRAFLDHADQQRFRCSYCKPAVNSKRTVARRQPKNSAGMCAFRYQYRSKNNNPRCLLHAKLINNFDSHPTKRKVQCRKTQGCATACKGDEWSELHQCSVCKLYLCAACIGASGWCNAFTPVCPAPSSPQPPRPQPAPRAADTWEAFTTSLQKYGSCTVTNHGGYPDCFFLCVLAMLKAEGITEPSTVPALRAVLADTLSSEYKQTPPYFEDIRSVVREQQYLPRLRSWHTYRTLLRTGPLYGGDLEISALIAWMRSKGHRLQIRVWTPERNEPQEHGSPGGMVWNFALLGSDYRVIEFDRRWAHSTV